jgi:hypothetical protein
LVKSQNEKLPRNCASSRHNQIIKKFEKISHEASKVFKEAAPLDSKKFGEIYDKLSQIVSEFGNNSIANFIDKLKNKTLHEVESLNIVNQTLMTCRNENLEVTNNFTKLMNTTLAQKRFINELIINITSIRKVFKENGWKVDKEEDLKIESTTRLDDFSVILTQSTKNEASTIIDTLIFSTIDEEKDLTITIENFETSTNNLEIAESSMFSIIVSEKNYKNSFEKLSTKSPSQENIIKLCY